MLPILLVAASPGTDESDDAGKAALLARVHSQDVLVEDVGFRLATANADLCASGWDAGFSVHTLEQYGPRYREAAAKLFRLDDHVGVLSVAAGSPAERAGLHEGDRIVRADGVALPPIRSESSGADFARTGAAQQLLADAFRDGIAVVSVTRDGRANDVKVHAAPACTSIFQTVPEREVNGEADGRYVQVSTEMAALAQSRDELAALLAHELAHNILGHRQRLDALHVDRGLFAPFGRNARLIRETEAEADRFSIHLMAHAGYAPEAALAFWERVRHATRGMAGSPTHPPWRERLQMMQAECDRIKAAGIAGTAALPADLASKLEARRQGAN